MTPFSHAKGLPCRGALRSAKQFRNSCKVCTASPPMGLFLRTTKPAEMLLFYSGADTVLSKDVGQLQGWLGAHFLERLVAATGLVGWPSLSRGLTVAATTSGETAA